MTTRARWSTDERTAVLEAYNTLSTKEEFYAFVRATVPNAPHRTAKAYLTYLNEAFPASQGPRRDIYQSLCDFSRTEIASANAASPTASSVITEEAEYEEVLKDLGSFATPPPAPPLAAWVEEINPTPLTPPRPVRPSLFRDPLAPHETEAPRLPTLTEAAAAGFLKTSLPLSVESPAKPEVKPDPGAITPRHLSPLPANREYFTTIHVALLLGVHKSDVEEALLHSIPMVTGKGIPRDAVEHLHRALSEGHSFKDACKTIPREPRASLMGVPVDSATLETPHGGGIPKYSPETTVRLRAPDGDKEPAVARTVNFTDVSKHGWTPRAVTEHPLPTSTLVEFAKVAQGPGLSPASGPEGVVGPTGPILPPASPTDPTVSGLHGNKGSEDVILFTLEGVREGILSHSQALDILGLSASERARWVLGLVTARKINLTQAGLLLPKAV